MGVRRWGRARGTFGSSSVVVTRVAPPMPARRLPVVLALIGVLLLTAVILAAAPAARAELSAASDAVAGSGNALVCRAGYLSAPNSPSVAFSGASDFTIEMWLRPHGGATGSATLCRQRNGGAGTLETWFALTADNRLFAGVQNYAYPGWQWLGFATEVPEDEWAHVALVKSGSSLSIYRDGQLTDSTTVGWQIALAAPSAAPLNFGGDDLEGNHVQGDLDEIQVYERALTGVELAERYNRGLGQTLGSGSGPVRYYRLDEESGASAADAGSDGVAATLTGMAADPWIESTAAREATSASTGSSPVVLAYGDATSPSVTVEVVQQPAHGTLTLTSSSLGRGTYQPQSGWTGTETFTYRVVDETAASDPVTAWVTSTGPDTHTWDGSAGDGKWSTAANWVGDELPSDGDSLVFPDGAPGAGYATHNDLLASVVDVTVGNEVVVGGEHLSVSGLLRGTGAVTGLTVEPGGSVSAGAADHGVGTLAAADVIWAAAGDADAAGRQVCDVADAAGDAGDGWDVLPVRTLDIQTTAEKPFVLELRSTDGAGMADAAGFDAKKHYRWPVVALSDGIIRWELEPNVVVDATGFTNDLQGGSFSAEPSADGSALEVVYTPSCPNIHVWTGLGFDGLWSNRWNWAFGARPSDGDTLEFVGLLGQVNSNDLLTSVGGVHIWNHGFAIEGDPLEMSGTLRSDGGFGGNDWGIETTLSGNAAMLTDCGYLNVWETVHLHDGDSGHGLTLRGGGTTWLPGGVDGAGTDCTVTKAGSGTAEVGGVSAFGGAVTVSEGRLSMRGTSSLPSGVPVAVSVGTTFEATTAAMGHGEGAWDNVLSGAGELRVSDLAYLRLTGDSPGFTGPVVVDGAQLLIDGRLDSDVSFAAVGGVIGGAGATSVVRTNPAGLLMPGAEDLESARLTVGGAVLEPGAAAAFVVTDDEGAAGTAYDQIRGTEIGPTEPYVESAPPFAVSLVSASGGAEGPLADWDALSAHRWQVMKAEWGLADLDLDALDLDTTQFATHNALLDGSFSLEKGSDGGVPTLDVVFTPVADFAADPVVGGGGDAFVTGGTQAVAWEMDAAPPAGSVFKVVADDPASGIDLLLATVPATSETEYGYDWTIAQEPSGGWHVAVQLWSSDDVGAVQYRSADSQTFDILSTSYTVAVGAGAHGSIAPGTGAVTTFADQEYTITADEGYHVSDVLVDGESVGAPATYTFEDVRADHTLSATFAVDTFTIMPSVTGGASGHGAISPGSAQTVDFGATPTFSFIPDMGYHVAEVLVDGEPVTMTGEDEYTFPPVAAGHAISVAFAVDTFEITVTAGGHGSITPGTGQVESGASQLYTIAPDSGYAVEDVVVDGQSVGSVPDYEFTDVQADHAIAASFVVTPEGMPWTTVAGASSRWSRRPVKLTFTAHPGATGAPIAFTEYRLPGKHWTHGRGVTVRTQGSTTVQFCCQDVDSVRETPARACVVRIDSRRPRVVARSLTAARGAVARLRYQVKDPAPSSGLALIRAVVVDARGRALTKASSVPASVNRWHAQRIKTGSLRPGTYTVVLRAKDRAGNFQKGVTRVRLTVL